MSSDITVNMDDFFKSLHLPQLYHEQKELQLTCFELIFHNYPLPIDEGFLTLPPPSRKATAPNMFALDCEMIITKATDGSLWRELARVSVVNHNLEVIFDVLVKPKYEISDYLTQYSGLTAEIMADAKISLEDAQQMFVERFDATTIFVGHSLEQDLRALRIVHLNIIDTAVLHCRKFSCNQKPKLKFLCALHLNRLIQTGIGHDSIEDAKAAMILALYFLVDPYVIGRYHLPHGLEASMFFEIHDQFFQINIIPSVDSMLWLGSFVAEMTNLVNTVLEKHPDLTLTICPYYYFMPNFEVESLGVWGGTFFIGIANENDPNDCKPMIKSSDESLDVTLETAFQCIVKALEEEQLHLKSSLLKPTEVPIWVWQPSNTPETSEADSTQGASEETATSSSGCTILPSPTPPSSVEETMNEFDVPPFVLDAHPPFVLDAHPPDTKPSSTPTPPPPTTPNVVLPLAELAPATLNKQPSEKRNRKKARWRRKKRRNKKKIAFRS